MVHPPRDYILDVPEEQGALDVLLRINCGGEQGLALPQLRLFGLTNARVLFHWEVDGFVLHTQLVNS